MTGLSEQDTSNYIMSRLKWAGCSVPIFKEDALAAIREYLYDFPRLIGNICEEALTYAMFCERKTVGADMILKIKMTDDMTTSQHYWLNRKQHKIQVNTCGNGQWDVRLCRYAVYGDNRHAARGQRLH